MYNNPGNIRCNRELRGVVDCNKNGFSIFESENAGIKAIHSLLKVYFNKYGLNTITKIISRYAPSSENQTGRYIDFVAQKSGYGKNQILEIPDLKYLLKSLIKMESGKDYTNEKLFEAIGEQPSPIIIPEKKNYLLIVSLGFIFASLFFRK
jgi:hypothetical protein